VLPSSRLRTIPDSHLSFHSNLERMGNHQSCHTKGEWWGNDATLQILQSEENSDNPKSNERNNERDEDEFDEDEWDELVKLISNKNKRILLNLLQLNQLSREALNASLGITWHFSNRTLYIKDESLYPGSVMN
jgi:hypothetical protein